MHPAVEVLWTLLLMMYHWFEQLVKCFIPLKYRMKNVKGQVVLITGTGSGIGRMLALGFGNLGAKIVCWDVNKAGNDETVRLVRMSGGEACGYVVDLCQREKIYETADKVKREVGKVNILINNAGTVTGRNFLDCSDTDIQRTFDVNIMAHFWTVKAFLPDMLAADSGHIVNVASLAGLTGCSQLVDYCASKFAAVGFDAALRTELFVEGRKGIKTTVVCPYFVQTPLFEGVTSSLLPILQADQVAQETIEAVLTNKEMLLLPKYTSAMMGLQWMLPVSSCMRLFKALGYDQLPTSMAGFIRNVPDAVEAGGWSVLMQRSQVIRSAEIIDTVDELGSKTCREIPKQVTCFPSTIVVA